MKAERTLNNCLATKYRRTVDVSMKISDSMRAAARPPMASAIAPRAGKAAGARVDAELGIGAPCSQCAHSMRPCHR